MDQDAIIKGIRTTYIIYKDNIDCPFRSYCIGETVDEINSKLKLRNLGEAPIVELSQLKKIYSTEMNYDFSGDKDTLLIDEDSDWQRMSILHNLAQTTFILIKAGLYSIEEVLSDIGIVHTLIHFYKCYDTKLYYEEALERHEKAGLPTPATEAVYKSTCEDFKIVKETLYQQLDRYNALCKEIGLL